MQTSTGYLIENEIIELYYEAKNNNELRSLLIQYEESNFSNTEIENTILEIIQSRFNKYNLLYGNIFETEILEENSELKEKALKALRAIGSAPGHIVGSILGGFTTGVAGGTFKGSSDAWKGLKRANIHGKIEYLNKLKDLYKKKIADSIATSSKAGLLRRMYHGFSRFNMNRKINKADRKINRFRDKLSLI